MGIKNKIQSLTAYLLLSEVEQKEIKKYILFKLKYIIFVVYKYLILKLKIKIFILIHTF